MEIQDRLRSNRRRPNTSEQGMIILMAVIFLAFLASIPIAMELTKTFSQDTKQQLAVIQAENAAKAGLADAVAWFRRQPVQPVSSALIKVSTYPDAAFNPQPPDTIAPAIGLVKEEPISETSWLWMRYEVKRQNVDNSANPALSDPDAAHDITGQKIFGQKAGDGLAWSIVSKGIVFRRKDPAKAYNQSPNEVVATARMSTEIRRIFFELPKAAIVVQQPAKASFGANTRIWGITGIGVAHFCVGSCPMAIPIIMAGTPPEVTGTPAAYKHLVNTQWSPFLVETYFGAKKEELKRLSTVYKSTGDLPGVLPTDFVFFDGNAQFSASAPLKGSGLFFVNGNLTVGDNTSYNGVIYVTGNFTATGEVYVGGTVVCEGNVSVEGYPNQSLVVYDEKIVSGLANQLGNYREISNRNVFSAHN